MKIYDISQEVFHCSVYPGDPSPKREVLCSIEQGDLYNLTAFSMCAHNGTHIDAPAHFLQNSATVEQISLSKTVGLAYVAEHQGILSDKDAERILARAEAASKDASKRILIKGDAEVSIEAAKVFARAEIDLLGNESQSVGPENAPMEVHKTLLEKSVVLLEGIRLTGVPQGVYLLCAAPLSLSGAEGAPCRAVLIENGN